MATSTSTYSLSFEKLKGLQRSAHPQHELTLPERPSGFETDSNPYLDSAIGMLGESAVYLYDSHHYMDSNDIYCRHSLHLLQSCSTLRHLSRYSTLF
jgi:hypothetical protein